MVEDYKLAYKLILSDTGFKEIKQKRKLFLGGRIKTGQQYVERVQVPAHLELGIHTSP